MNRARICNGCSQPFWSDRGETTCSSDCERSAILRETVRRFPDIGTSAYAQKIRAEMQRGKD